MLDDLLTSARKQAIQSAPEVRLPALMHLARVLTKSDPKHARELFSFAMVESEQLPGMDRYDLFDLAHRLAAAVAPELLNAPQFKNPRLMSVTIGGPPALEHETISLVLTMLAHGHAQAAADYVVGLPEESFSYRILGNIFDKVSDPARRYALSKKAVDIWHSRHAFEFGLSLSLFERHKVFPDDELRVLLREYIDAVLAAPDHATSAQLGETVHFTSRRELDFFNVLHLLRRLDLELSDRLLSTYPQLEAGARRYPNGMETLHEEAQAAIRQRMASGATCEGGYILCGSGDRYDAQMALLQASRDGNFDPVFRFALEDLEKDTNPEKPNAALKTFWYAAGTYRSIFYSAGTKLGGEAAAALLNRIPDLDLRLFAQIELTAALAGLPQMQEIRRFRATKPSGNRPPRSHRIVSTQMFFSAGELMPGIRCPECKWEPRTGDRWMCRCGHTWNTFTTGGRCPQCSYEWEETACLHCHERPPHKAWYVPQNPEHEM